MKKRTNFGKKEKKHIRYSVLSFYKPEITFFPSVFKYLLRFVRTSFTLKLCRYLSFLSFRKIHSLLVVSILGIFHPLLWIEKTDTF